MKPMKFNVPGRKFCSGEKKMISMRLPETLLIELEKISRQKQWNLTELFQIVLDQFAQQESVK